MKCLNCDGPITSPQARKYCSRRCGLLYRDRVVYKGCYSVDYYSKSPLNFFRSSLQKKRHKREEISAEFLASLWDKQGGLCALTGFPMTIVKGEGRVMTNASIDRIDSSIGYSEGNLQLVCLLANLMKQQSTLPELRKWCQAILDYTDGQGYD